MRKQYKPIKYKLKPDNKYNNYIIAKLINTFMISGNKLTAENIIYSVMNLIRIKFLINPLTIITKAVNKLKPLLSIKRYKLGGSIYTIPFNISNVKSISIALKWIKKSLINYNYNNIIKSLFIEFISLYNGTGYSIIIRDNLYRVACLNRAYSLY